MEHVDLIWNGIALAPVIVAIIQGLKLVGMPTKYAPVANGLLSLLVFAVIVATRLRPEYVQVVDYVVNAIIYFLAGAGLYEAVKPSLPQVVRAKAARKK